MRGSKGLAVALQLAMNNGTIDMGQSDIQFPVPCQWSALHLVLIAK